MLDWHSESKAWQASFQLSERQFPYAVAGTLTGIAVAAAKAQKAEIQRIFHNPTAFVVNSVLYRPAKVQGNTIQPARVLINPQAPRYVAPSHILTAEIEGGSRMMKGSEDLLHESPYLKQSNLLQDVDEQQWVPGAKAPTTPGGDVQGGELRRIISAFQGARDKHALGTMGATNSRIAGFKGITAREHSRIVLGPTTLEERTLTAKQRFEQRIAAVQQKKNRFNYLVGESKGAGKPRIIYQYDWVSYQHKFADGTTMTAYRKDHFKPILYFTKVQHYHAKALDFYGINETVAQTRGPAIFRDVAARVFTKMSRA